MDIFAVTYSYVATPEALNALRPIHREFLSELFDLGILLASGPFVGSEGALLIIQAEDLNSVSALLDQDPFDIAGYIGERVITEWNPVFGPWSNK